MRAAAGIPERELLCSFQLSGEQYILWLMQKKPHIIIVGSGLAGLTCVATLAHVAGHITLLERDASHSVAMQQDERPISLSYSSVLCFKNLGLWESLAPYSAVIKRVHVSEQYHFGSLTLTAADAALDALGYVLPFYKVQHVLQQWVAQHILVQYELINDVTRIEESEHRITVTCDTHSGEKTFAADYLIAADGASSRCRGLLNIKTVETQRHDQAVTAILTLATPHQHTAYERFTKSGVFALLPMWDAHQYRLVWTTDIAQQENVSDEHIMEMVKEVFGSRIGTVTELKCEGSYPLTTRIAQRTVTQRCILIGDSAHRLYPLTAQGYNLTVRDCAQLVEILANNQMLADYARLRAADQKCIIQFTQSVEWVFGLQLPLLSSLRAAVLFKLDCMPVLKKQLILRLLGRMGRQPELLCED